MPTLTPPRVLVRSGSGLGRAALSRARVAQPCGVIYSPQRCCEAGPTRITPRVDALAKALSEMSSPASERRITRSRIAAIRHAGSVA